MKELLPAGTSHRVAGALVPIIDRIEGFLAQSRCFPKLEADRASLEVLLAQIKARQASLETPLRILLLGGTGVGKSSLLNALAGEDIARVAATRPTTRELTAYFHKETGSGSLGALEAKAKLVPHERAPLRDKVVVDAPDFDSTHHENRELLERALESADLALVVVTPEKYLAHELFTLLERYRDGLAFVFILNKCDLERESALVVEDLRRELERRRFRDASGGPPRILPVSALKARHAGMGDGAGAWPELLLLLERELDRVRIREIKASKLQDRVRALLERIEAAVPEDSPRRLEGWRLAWRSALADLTADLGHAFFGALRSDFELRNVLGYLFGTSMGGLFGAFMTLVYGVRSLLQPGFSRARRLTARELDELLGERLRSVDPASIERRVALVFERFEDEGRRHGFVAPQALGATTLERGGLPASVSALAAAVRTESAKRFYEVFEETLGQGRRGVQRGRIVWNLIPFAVVAFSIYAFVDKVWRQIAAGAGFDAMLIVGQAPALAQATLVAWVIACLVQWPLAERTIQRRIASSFELLEGVVSSAVQQCLGEAILQRPEKALEEVAARFQELEHLRKDARRILAAEEPRPAPPKAPPREASAPPEAPKEAAKAPPERRVRG